MFNLKHFKLVKELTKQNIQSNWLRFSFTKNSPEAKEELLNSIIKDNSFLKEDSKIRAMVEDMLVKEFTEEIKNIKSYDFLVDSVVNKLKQKQLEDMPFNQEIK